jgi:hypothetical protein
LLARWARFGGVLRLATRLPGLLKEPHSQGGEHRRPLAFCPVGHYPEEADSATAAVAQMNNTTVVDVFLGHPLVDSTEQQFLARLQHDLAAAGCPAVVLANVQLERQVDFVVITDARACVLELKGWRDPVIARVNGRWQRIVEGNPIDADGNPYRQAQECGFALSDLMRKLAKAGGLPGPRSDKFVKDLDVLVCMYPAVDDRSSVEKHPWVRVLSYEDVLARLQRPGPRPEWSREEWDSLIRHLGLYRDGEDAETARAQRRSTALVDEYCARFAAARGLGAPLVPTGVRFEGTEVERPDLAGELLAGRDQLLWGASGQGKSLWAQASAVQLARSGHVPVWLPVRSYADGFSTFLARAVAPYTTVSAKQLIAAARASGRHVVFIVDGLNERPEDEQAEVLGAVQALRLHAPSHAVLVTAQAPQAPGFDSRRTLELRPLDDQERRAVLDAYGTPVPLELFEGVTTPLELATAASCVTDVGAPDGAAEFLDAYIELEAASETVRAVLRALAWRMQEELRLSLRVPDAARGLRRVLGIDSAAVATAFDNRLVRLEHGRVAFAHERFARLLAAEELLERCVDGAAVAAQLNLPRGAQLRADAVGLERDEGRLGSMLAALEDVEVLVAAACGEVGQLAQGVARGLLTDALRVACTQMASTELTFTPTGLPPFDMWQLPWQYTAAERAQLQAAGRCVARGLLVDEAARLLLLTDQRCRDIEAGLGLAEGRRRRASTASAGPPTGT